MPLPDFDDADTKRLHKLGLSDAQVMHLRYKLPFVRAIANTDSYAARSDVIDHLSTVENLAHALEQKLAALVLQPSVAHGVAHGLIEEGYWQNERVHDTGPTSSHHLAPRLRALADASRSARANLPAEQTRARIADPRPIAQIAAALMSGWLQAQGSRVRQTPANESLEDMIAGARANPPLPPYPKAFQVSAGERSAFREIAGICYRTVDGTDDPVSAIRAYMSQKRAARKEALDSFEAGLAAADRGKQ